MLTYSSTTAQQCCKAVKCSTAEIFALAFCVFGTPVYSTTEVHVGINSDYVEAGTVYY